MTVKALKRQLMAAIAMIMVSLVALSSSTYAWFTMNKTVTARGLTVKARTEGGILIKRTISSGEGTDSTMFASPNTVSLFPTNKGPTPANAEFKKTWVHATASRADNSAADPNTYAKLAITEQDPQAAGLGYGYTGTSPSQGNFYYVYDTFTIQKDQYSKSFTDLYVSACTVEKKSENGGSTAVAPISKALRVLVKCGEREFIYAPVDGASSDYKIITEITTSETTVTPTKVNISSYTTTNPSGTSIPVYKSTSNTGTLPLTINDGALYQGVYDDTVGDGLEVTVYVYFEGEDANLMADNIQAGLDDLILTIKFSCSSVTPK